MEFPLFRCDAELLVLALGPMLLLAVLPAVLNELAAGAGREMDAREATVGARRAGVGLLGRHSRPKLNSDYRCFGIDNRTSNEPRTSAVATLPVAVWSNKRLFVDADPQRPGAKGCNRAKDWTKLLFPRSGDGQKEEERRFGMFSIVSSLMLRSWVDGGGLISIVNPYPPSME